MKVTYYGHACFGVEIANKHLLFDPFITPNELAKDVNVDRVPADYIPRLIQERVRGERGSGWLRQPISSGDEEGSFFGLPASRDKTPSGRRCSCRRQCARDAVAVRAQGGRQRSRNRSSMGLGRRMSRKDQTG